MTTTPHPGHPHRPVRRDRRRWTSPTFDPQTDPAPYEQLCWDDETGSPWSFSDPHRNETAIAYTDNDTATLIREAVVTLTIFRAPMGLGDAGATVSTLVSLAAEADGQLWDAVADAHDQGYTWDEIASPPASPPPDAVTPPTPNGGTSSPSNLTDTVLARYGPPKLQVGSQWAFMTFHDDRATRIQGHYAIDLTPPERSVLRAGLHEWLGPARCTDAVAVTIGFADWEEFHAHIHPLIVALDHSEPLTGQDWRRVLISAEVSFGSDLLGCGVDWPTVTGLSDLDTIALLRGLQRKLAAVVRGHGPGNSGCVKDVDQTA